MTKTFTSTTLLNISRLNPSLLPSSLLSSSPDIAVAALSLCDTRRHQLPREKSALGTTARTHVVSGFSADLWTATDGAVVMGVPPRGVPV